MTISYGPLPSEVYLAYFGFLPQPNPYESVVIFETVRDLAVFHNTFLSAPANSKLLEDRIAMLLDDCPPGDYSRYRLLCALFTSATSVLRVHQLLLLGALLVLDATCQICMRRWKVSMFAQGCAV